MSELDNITGRAEEIEEIIGGLTNLDQELRQAAAQNLGRADHTLYVGLTAQATMLANLRQTLKLRLDMLKKAQAEQGPTPDEPLHFPRRVPEGDEPVA